MSEEKTVGTWPVGKKRGPMSDEHKRKLSEAQRGRIKSGVHKRKISRGVRANRESWTAEDWAEFGQRVSVGKLRANAARRERDGGS